VFTVLVVKLRNKDKNKFFNLCQKKTFDFFCFYYEKFFSLQKFF